MNKSEILLKEEFIIKEIDKDGKKFSSISRIECSAKNKEIEVILDVNADIFPIESTKYEICLIKWHNNGYKLSFYFNH